MPPMHSHIRDYWITFSAPLEGLVDFMYLDARGWVSTGRQQSSTVTFFQETGRPPKVSGGGGAPPAPPSPSAVDLNTTRGVQQALAILGFDPGPIDGVDWPLTRAAVAVFQSTNGLDPDGIVGEQTRAALGTGLTDAGFEVLADR
jgi:peptidoglycan hydrolase-like protein with peptidoglycan-binding domain